MRLCNDDNESAHDEAMSTDADVTEMDTVG